MAEQFGISFLLKLVDNLSSPLVKVGAAFDEIDKKFSSVGKTSRELGQKMSMFATLPIAGWATYAAHEAGKVGVAFREMGNSLVDLPADKLARLKTELLDMTTIVPRSAEELADYAQMAGKMNELGSVKGFVEFMAAFTSANEDMRGQESAFMDMVRSLQLAQGEYAHTGDVITTLSQRMNTSASSIVQTSNDLAHLKKTTKITTDELMALSAWTDTFGASGGMAMKQFTRTMSEAAQGMDPLKLAVIAQAAGFGTNTAKFQQEFEKSPAKMMGKLLEGLSSMEKEGRIYQLQKVLDVLGLSGNRVLGTVLRGSSAYTELYRSLGLVNDKAAVNGKMMREAGDVYTDFSSQTTMLLGALNKFAAQFGKDIKPVFMWFIGSLKSILDVFTKLPAWLRYSIEGFLAIVAVLGPLLIAFAAIKGAIAVVGMAMSALIPIAASLGAALGPILAVIAVAAAGWKIGGWISDRINDATGGAGIGGKIYDWTHPSSAAGGVLSSRGEATIKVELDRGLKAGEVKSRGNVSEEVMSEGYAGMKFAY